MLGFHGRIDRGNSVSLAQEVVPSDDAKAASIAALAQAARRILQEQCFSCHGEMKSESGLRLDRREDLLCGGDRGPALTPQSPLQSLLLRTIDGSDPDLEMPPEKPLRRSDVETLRSWLEHGAPAWSDDPHSSVSESSGDAWSDPNNPIARKFGRERLDLWSLRPIRRPPLPKVHQKDWPYNPIDTFLLAEWEKRGLVPAPDVDRRSLARRASFDIVGLPPTAEQVAEFAANVESNAEEQFTESLLASYQHGEHLARMWLDVVRYSDSNGFDWDEFRPQAWRYRDYVVRSFNRDIPFDRFVTEQLAGDELIADKPKSNDQIDALIATGFLRLGPHDNAASLFNEQERSRQELLSDLTETTGSAFLGLTMSCCRCHDHKTDPLSQQDHYRLRAFFAGVEFADDLALQVESEVNAIDQYNAPLVERIEQIEKQIVDLQKSIDLESTDPSKKQESQQTLDAIQAEKRMLKGQLKKPQTGLVMSEDRNKLSPTYVLYQGDPQAKREEVFPGFPSLFSPQAATLRTPVNPRTSGRRLTLADWMTAPDNPWTARIMVNRLWQHYFGRGLVPTPNDFGLSGEPPEYPELLDWLASEFMQHGWSIRHIERLILSSHAYRMQVVASSEAANTPAMVSIRKSMKRLSAEQLRDAVLAASGLLQHRVGGPPVWPSLPEEILQANPAFLDDNETKTKGWYPSPRKPVRTIDLPRSEKNCSHPNS